MTSDRYEPVSNSVNGSGFRPFDVVIPFSFRKGEITGEKVNISNISISQTSDILFLPSGEVFMPSGKSTQPTITDNMDGTVTVLYSPTEAGLHEMHIKHNGTHIPGEPSGAEAKL